MDDMIIIGASGGIGRYLGYNFCRSHRLFLTYNQKVVSVAAMEDARMTTRLDITSYHEVREFVEKLSDLTDRIVLINAAGININDMGHKMNPPDFYWVINANLCGVFNVCSMILPIMRKKGWGRIINLSSVVGQIGVPGTVAYSASKAGLLGLTRTLAVENAGKGITVNALNLGYMDIGMIRDVPVENVDKLLERIPMKRLGDPSNIVDAIRFLIAADYVTGTAIDIDGGLLCS